MPRGREPEGEAPLSNAERQARYRARHKEKQASVIIRPPRPIGRRSRIQRWHAAVAKGASAAGGCHLYFAHRVTFLSCADRTRISFRTRGTRC